MRDRYFPYLTKFRPVLQECVDRWRMRPLQISGERFPSSWWRPWFLPYATAAVLLDLQNAVDNRRRSDSQVAGSHPLPESQLWVLSTWLIPKSPNKQRRAPVLFGSPSAPTSAQLDP